MSSFHVEAIEAALSGLVDLQGPGPDSSESGKAAIEDPGPGSNSRGDLIDPTKIAGGSPGSSGASSSSNGGGSLGEPCTDLLAGRVYSCPTSPPDVSQYTTCIRDQYVAAAITYCWEAYCYVQNGDGLKAGPAEDCAKNNVCLALDLCSNAPGTGGTCDTLDVLSCDAPPSFCPTDCTL